MGSNPATPTTQLTSSSQLGQGFVSLAEAFGRQRNGHCTAARVPKYDPAGRAPGIASEFLQKRFFNLEFGNAARRNADVEGCRDPNIFIIRFNADVACDQDVDRQLNEKIRRMAFHRLRDEDV